MYVYAFLLTLLLALAGAQPLTDKTSSGGPIVPGHPQFALRILPLGASITWGQESTDGNGYREDLRELLQQRSTTVDMVGTVHAGHMSDNENEGHPGARVDQVAVWAEKDIHYMPNLILINAGTNDVLHELQGRSPINKIGERMGNLTEYLFDKIPNVTVIVSTLIINTHKGADERIRKIVNPQYETLVKREQKKKKRILLCDLHPVVKAKELVDGTHPDDKGYQKIADAWLKAIAEAGSKGLLVESKNGGTPGINVPPKIAGTVVPSTPTATSKNTIPSESYSTPSLIPRISQVPAKAPAHSGTAIPSQAVKSNAARSIKLLWLSWWY